MKAMLMIMMSIPVIIILCVARPILLSAWLMAAVLLGWLLEYYIAI